VQLGKAVVIFAGVIVNPGTAIEDNVCLNTGASIDHDNWLRNSCHVFPQATLTGGVQVGEFTSIGSNATVNPYVKIGRDSIVGSGAVVLRDVADGVVVAGVPARVIREQAQRSASSLVRGEG
jgi:acetyltransferase-like isoleucine patch superfamily enzyme